MGGDVMPASMFVHCAAPLEQLLARKALRGVTRGLRTSIRRASKRTVRPPLKRATALNVSRVYRSASSTHQKDVRRAPKLAPRVPPSPADVIEGRLLR